MTWQQIFFALHEIVSEGHFQAVQNDLAREVLAQLLADPKAGDGATPVNLHALAERFRAARGIQTQGEWREAHNARHAQVAALRGGGMKPEAIAAALRAQGCDEATARHALKAHGVELRA